MLKCKLVVRFEKTVIEFYIICHHIYCDLSCLSNMLLKSVTSEEFFVGGNVLGGLAS